MFRFDVFGRHVGIARAAAGWVAYDLGADGKRRPADFPVPAFLAEEELLQYLADLFHESASRAHPEVKKIAR